MKVKLVVSAAVGLISMLALEVFATPNTITLNCAKISHKKTEAELAQSEGIYTLNVSFIVKRPTAKEIDHALRECLTLAVKRDHSKDILVTPWFRRAEKDNPNDDAMLHPYGPLTNLTYEASTKATKLYKLELKKKTL
ncbi:MAG TPA: hypothetical protein VIK56_15645 [Rhodoferax sp.]